MKYRIAAYISIIVLTGCAGTAIQQRTELLRHSLRRKSTQTLAKKLPDI
jgi:hypothetical protein